MRFLRQVVVIVTSASAVLVFIMQEVIILPQRSTVSSEQTGGYSEDTGWSQLVSMLTSVK